MAKFNKQQEIAIASRRGNFLVSAGAGSGKTQVLTTRIKEIIQSGDAKVDELLVLTFTNKAAAEMKKRTRTELLKVMPEAAEQVETSDITTFDAFFLKLVKKYAYKLGVDPDISVADDIFLEIRKTETIENLLAKKYLEMDETTVNLIHNYALKNEKNITKYVYDIIKGASLVSDPKAYFRSFKEIYFEDSYFERRKKEFYEKCNDDFKAAFELSDFGSSNTLATDHLYIASFLNLGSYESLYERIAIEAEAKANKLKTFTYNGKEVKIGLGTRSTKKDPLTDEEEIRHSVVASLVNGVVNNVKLYGDPKRQIEKIKSTKPYVDMLIDIAEATYDDLNEYKKEKNVYSFSDIAALARKLLDNQEVCDYLKNKYKFIMVDEYQDTSDLQEEFISKIANDNLFVVGDIKQSIYRFRNANPDIFSGKLNDYSKKIGGEVIPLQINYRSRKEVIDIINSLFERIMSPSIGDVDYNNGQSLEFGNTFLYGSEDKPEYKAKILKYEKPSDMDVAEAEAKIIAKDIIDKVNSGFLLDVKDEGRRPCTWKDFAILIPNKGQFNTYKKVFGEAKIPLVATVNTDFSEDNINLLFMSLLKLPLVVDENKIQTKHCYASIKRSYIYQEDDDQLIDEFQNETYLDDQLIQDMKKDKYSLLSMTVYDATMYLIEKYGLIKKLLVTGDVKENFEKINHLMNLALIADRMGLTYETYVDHFSQLKKFKLVDEIDINPVAGDQVQLMSIHASKGLEFPVVYCPNNDRAYNNEDAKGYYITAKGYGLLLPFNRTDEVSTNFVYRLFKDEEASKALSEYMRLFYVSLTRASDQIIFLSKAGKDERYYKFKIQSTGKDYLGKISTKINKDGEEETSYAESSITSFSSFLHLAGDDFVKQNFTIEEVGIEDSQNKKEVLSAEAFDAPSLKSIDFEAQIVETRRASKDSLKPGDIETMEIGTRLHRLLELTDFATKDTSFINDEKDRKMVDKVLSHEIFNDVGKYKIFKEYQYFDEEENVNGIIDLLLVEKGGDAVIVDYKTSKIDDPAYVDQLKTYKRYVDRVFGVNARTYLLSIMKGELKVVE